MAVKQNKPPESRESKNFSALMDSVNQNLRSDPVKAMNYAQSALAAARRSNELSELSQIWLALGALNLMLGQASEALPFLKKAIRAFDELGDPAKTARARGNLANAYNAIGDTDKAEKQYRILLKEFEQLGDQVSMGRTHYNLGIGSLNSNRYMEALEHYQAALKIFAKHPTPPTEADIHCMMGAVYARLMDYEENLRCCQKALEIAHREDNPLLECNVYTALGNAYLFIKQYQLARQYCEKSLALARKQGLAFQVASNLTNLAEVLTGVNKNKEALAYAEEALALDLEMDLVMSIAKDHYTIGRIYFLLEKFANSEKHLAEADKIFREHNLTEGLITNATLRINNLVKLRKYAQSARILQELEGLLVSLPVSELHLLMYEAGARLYSSQGEHKQANEYYRMHHELTREYITQESQRRAQHLQIAFETAQKEKEKRHLARQNRMLEKRVKEEVAKHREKDRRLAEQENMALLGRVTAGIAHELNNPLAAIKQAVEITLQALEKGSKGKLYLAEKQTDIYNMLYRINRLVEIVKVISHSPDRFTNRPFQINDIIAEFTDLFAERILEKDIVLFTKLAGRLPLVNGDGIRFLQVISILAGNASDALSQSKAPGVKKIAVKTSLDGDHVVVAVSDNGPGMSPEQLALIRQPFYSTKDVDKGMGMGIPIATSIIANMKGSLEIASQPGTGTTVTLVLPAFEEGGER